MDLFVINRYNEYEEDVDLVSRETVHLQKLKQKIEERKKAYFQTNTVDEITLKEKKPDPISDETNYSGHSTNENKSEINVLGTVTLGEQKLSKDVSSALNEKHTSEFKVLGVTSFEKKNTVKRILPYWLSHPFSVSTNLQQLTCKVEDQDWLHKILKTTLANENVTHLFPVQEKVIQFIIMEHKINHIFWPHDICVSAPTGSGKTLSFVLPIIQLLMGDIGRCVRALIVLPVQELAVQVAKVFKKYCTNTGLQIALLSGSIPFRQEQLQVVCHTESSGWQSKVDILVCTAGRLVEHIQNTEGFSLKNLKFLVIDEADRIMDHIQNDWLYHVDKHIKLENELITGKVANLNWENINKQKTPPQKLLFSATLSQDPEKLEQWGLFQPKLFSAAPINEYEDDDNIRKYSTPAELRENTITCNAEDKPLVLYHLLVEQKWDKVLCFTNSSQTAHRLTILLNTWATGDLKVAELSSALNRHTREEVLKKFTNSEINVLVGTDALARGIDIPYCNYVISYDPPRNIKTYIHRVGRTGRAGREGTAVTLLLPNLINSFKELLLSGKKKSIPEIEIKPEVISRLAQDYKNAIQKTKETIHAEVNNKVQKSINLKRGIKSRPKKRKYESVG